MALHLKLDPDETSATIVRFIRDYFAAAGAKDAVIGLSGGLDSAVVAALAARALGPTRVHAYALPSKTNVPADLDDARAVANILGISLETRDIQPLVDAALKSLGGEKTVAVVANVMARSRMILLYAEAQRHKALVLGTGNKSELLTGYFTKHGDGGSDLLPIGDLYKTQVRELAPHLGIPSSIIAKPPTAGLFQGQTDEADLGMAYTKLDLVLLGLEVDLPPERIAKEAGVAASEVARLETVRRRSQHKRQAPPMPKLGIRTSGTDWRDPVMGRHAVGG